MWFNSETKGFRAARFKNKAENTRPCYHETQLLSAAVAPSCRWNQSFVSVKLRGRRTNNTLHSDVRRHYTADNEISQGRALVHAAGSLFLTKTAYSDLCHQRPFLTILLMHWLSPRNYVVGFQRWGNTTSFVSNEGRNWKKLMQRLKKTYKKKNRFDKSNWVTQDFYETGSVT